MLKTLVASAGIAVVFFLASVLNLGYLLHPQKWIILGFFIAVSYLFHFFSEQGMADNQDKFVLFYLSNVVIRFFLYLIFIGLKLYVGIEQPILFVLNFFALYLFYTIFENINLYRKLRPNS